MMNATDLQSVLTLSQRHYITTNRPFYYIPRTQIFSFVADNVLAVAAPVVAYWALSLVFHIMDMSDWKWLEKYRLHDSAEVQVKNRATRMEVFKAVIYQQIVQTVIGLLWVENTPTGDAVDHLGAMTRMVPWLLGPLRGFAGEKVGSQIWYDYGAYMLYAIYWWAIPTSKLFFAMFIIDTWQYFLHRGMHMNTYLFNTLHIVHHRLYVPYAYGALYNHPIEGLLLDTCGAGLAEFLAGMATRETMLIFVVSTFKTVDDHCGYKLPWDPLQMFSGNTADYHDIHHQMIGIKSNFSQPFFIHWDVILGTRMTRKDIARRRQKVQEKQE